MTPFDLLHLWLAFTLPEVCRLRLAPDIAADEVCSVPKVVGPVASSGGSFAYLTCRRFDESQQMEPGLWEFGARGFGPEASELAELVVSEVRRWDTGYRYGPLPRIVAIPTHLPAQQPEIGHELVKQHVRVAVHWD